MHHDLFIPLRKDIKNPDSSPVTESWERNARDCTRKSIYKWNMTKIFYMIELKDLRRAGLDMCLTVC